MAERDVEDELGSVGGPHTKGISTAELRAVQAFEAEHGIDSSVRGPHTKDRLTRGNIKNVIQFSVNQEDEGTCAIVTAAKVCVYNVIGLGMDTTLTSEEKRNLDTITKIFELSSKTPLGERDLNGRLITPEMCSPRGYTLIVLFFYFYDWLKMHHFFPYYRPGPKINMTDDRGEPYFSKKKDLFDFLKLTKKRAGLQFTSSGWVMGITTPLERLVAPITWKMISVCTLNTPWSSDVPSFDEKQFQDLCTLIFKITKKFKIILTLRGTTVPLHDVMLVGIENGHLIISNSWGKPIDLVPMNELPSVELTLPDSRKQLWHAFQFTFLLPSIPSFEHSLIDLKTQYYAEDLEELITGIDPYLSEMNGHTFPEIIDEALLSALASDPAARIGGTKRLRKSKRARKSKGRYTRFVYRLRQ